MTIHKDCADHLRAHYRGTTGGRLSSGHAHELVAAFFGYHSGAALRAEGAYPVEDLSQADILIPDLATMALRRQQISGLPADLAEADILATEIETALRALGHFGGEIWLTNNLAEFLDYGFLQKDPMLIEDGLSGEIASTNAFFDELYVEEVSIDLGDEALTAEVSGHLNGETDQDRPFHGDSITFTSVITFARVAGRAGFTKAEVETSGSVDLDRYYDEEEA